MIRVTLRVNGQNANLAAALASGILSKLIQQSVRTQWKFVVQANKTWPKLIKCLLKCHLSVLKTSF